MASLLGEHDELRPPMMRVRLEGDEAFPLQVVDDALHVLAVRAQVAGERGDRVWVFGVHDGAKDRQRALVSPSSATADRPRSRAGC